MSGSEEKSLPATLHKLRKARERGEVPRAKDLVAAAVTGAALLALLFAGPGFFGGVAEALRDAAALDAQPPATALPALAARLGWIGLGLVGPALAAAIGAAVLASLAGQGGPALSFQPLLPKLDRLDPVRGFGQLFQLRTLVELVKILLKLGAVAGICTVLIRDALPSFGQVPGCGLPCLPGVLRSTLLPLLAACCILLLIFGLLDIGLQRWLFRREQRMTRTEHKRERKDTEGDPALLARRRQERQEAARLGTGTGLRHATFVIHAADAAYAFRYARPGTPVPVLVARATGPNASRLATEARRRGLPVVFDPDATRALAGRVQIGKMIPQSVFPPVILCMRAAGIL